MSHGFMPGYEVHELEEMKAVVGSLSWDLADRIKGIVLLQRG